MHQLPAAMWNRIAQTGHPTTVTFRTLMSMGQDELDAAMGSLSRRLERVESDLVVRLAWMTVAPLLMENVAISRAVEAGVVPREAVPEATTVNEALLLAIREFNLDRSRMSKLRRLLMMPLPAPGA